VSAVRHFKIAIAALGGQGGGVLADWIVKLGERAGYISQSTSVPGVAQRTGATVYYVELFPESEAIKRGKSPILALMPAPGDVDIVLAAEMMEAGRAISRGFVTDQTILIASSHREYSIGEKIAMGDGRLSASEIFNSAEKCAARFIVSDLASEAAEAGAAISSVLFGALAGSGALPIEREKFEEIIRSSDRAVDRNLVGFSRGADIAGRPARIGGNTPPTVEMSPGPAQQFAAPIFARLEKSFPVSTHKILLLGLNRVIDFLDMRYGELYLDRVEQILKTDAEIGGEKFQWRLTESTAKHLALWMAYDDVIRVADLKTRSTRFSRFRSDVRALDGQIVHVKEFLHPRMEEICDLLPTAVARFVMNSDMMRKVMTAVIGGGRQVTTTKLRGFLILNFIGSLTFLRRSSYRYQTEESRITEWLSAVQEAAGDDYRFACEIAGLQSLIKGYGDTYARGLRNFNSIMAIREALRASADPAQSLNELRLAALADEEGMVLQTALGPFNPTVLAS
jgi:indolepyruvate ferredoxin oxidoreductase beta subunit